MSEIKERKVLLSKLENYNENLRHHLDSLSVFIKRKDSIAQKRLWIGKIKLLNPAKILETLIGSLI